MSSTSDIHIVHEGVTTITHASSAWRADITEKRTGEIYVRYTYDSSPVNITIDGLADASYRKYFANEIFEPLMVLTQSIKKAFPKLKDNQSSRKVSTS